MVLYDLKRKDLLVAFYFSLAAWLLYGLLSFFLDANKIEPLLNCLLGHALSQVGLEKINQLYFRPLANFFLWSGLTLFFAGWLSVFKIIPEAFFSLAERVWLRFCSWRVWQWLLFLLLLNLAIRLTLLFLTSESSLAHDGAEYIDIARNLLAGRGLVSHLVYNLNYRLDVIPYPVALFPPLFPILVFLAFGLGGASFFVAGLVNVIFYSLLPLMLFVLAERISGDRKLSLLASLLLTFNPIIIGASNQILTEASFTFFSLVFLFFLFNKKASVFDNALAGLFLALASLVRIQGLILLMPIALIYFIFFASPLSWKKKCKALLVVAIFACLTLSPWLVRNYLVFGQPIYFSENSATWLQTYQGVDSVPLRYFDSLRLVATSSLLKLLELWRLTPLMIVGNFFVFLALVYGLALTFKKKMFFNYLFVLLIAEYYVFFCFFKPLPRYLYPLAPFLAYFSALGFKACYQSCRQTASRFSWFKIVALIVFFSLSLNFTVAFLGATRLATTNNYDLDASQEAANYFFANQVDPGNILAGFDHPNFLNYYLPDSGVVIMPNTSEQLTEVIKKFNIKYIILSARRADFFSLIVSDQNKTAVYSGGRVYIYRVVSY